tara:strand:+ start:1430 stop:1732 length:303 start_codon:yes stop_codon:yes gene_type:complete
MDWVNTLPIVFVVGVFLSFIGYLMYHSWAARGKHWILKTFFDDSIRIAGTGGMTLKELKAHRKKSLATICHNCKSPHSLRLTAEKVLTCVECGHQQPTEE